MLTIGICFGVGVIVAAVIVFLRGDEFWVSLPFGFVFLGALIAGVIGSNAPYEIETETEYIYSLNDTISVDGSFVLGSGSVDGELEYWYFVKDDNGALEYRSISAGSVVIKFDDNPRIERYEMVFEESLWTLPNSLDPIPKTTLFIPENCVIDKISIDLE